MAKFVCPECEAEITGEDQDRLIGMAIDHMEEEHGKRNFSARYAKGNIEAHS